MSDDLDLDELERRVNGRGGMQPPEVLSLISRCRAAEKERDEAVKRADFYCRKQDALQLQLDSLNAAMKEGAEAEKELVRHEAFEPTIKNLAAEVVSLRAQLARWPEAVATVRERYPEFAFPSDGQSIDCKSARMARLACDEIIRLATGKE